MLWEVTTTQLIEADEFFEAVDEIKRIKPETEEVISICPYIEDEYMID